MKIILENRTKLVCLYTGLVLGFILDTHLDARACRNTSIVDRGSLLYSTYNLFRATWCMAFQICYGWRY